MRYLKHGFHMFSKHFLLNILLAIQLVITLLALNFTIGQYNSQMDAVNQFENFANQNGVYFMPNFDRLEYHPIDSENHKEEKIDEAFLRSKLKKADSFAYIKQAALINEHFPTERPLEVIIYSDELLRCCTPSMRQGSWLNKADANQTGIPAVIIGGELNDNSFRFFSDRQSFCRVSVIGEVAQSGKMLSFTTSGEGVTCLELYQIYDNKFYQQPKIYLRYSDVKEYEQEFYYTQSSYFILFENNISEQEKSDNISFLKQYGYVKTFPELLDAGREQMRTYMCSFLSLAVCAMSIAIIGIISMTALSVIKSFKTFAILYLCGYKWNDVIKIILGYLGCIIVSSALMFTFLTAIIVKADIIFQMQLLIGLNNLFYSIGTVVLVAVVALVIPLLFIHQNSPLKTIRSWGE